MLTKSCSKVASKFSCLFCHYFTDKKSSYDKHLLTAKHCQLTKVNTFSNFCCSKDATDIKEFICDSCSKNFKSRVGLWKHKKMCTITESPKTDFTDKDLIMLLIKDNSELKNMMMKVIENGTNNHSHNNNNTNSHNKAFNLNFFLNETCKNAMNITDFVDSIKLQLTDLMEVGELGYVEGISKIIVKNLNNLDETIRPIHCTDKKRETFYVKDQGQWEKENEERKKIKKVINTVANKNIRLLPQFREKYPDYSNSSSKTSDKYDKIVVEVMTTDGDKNEKIIKKISNATIINKT